MNVLPTYLDKIEPVYIGITDYLEALHLMQQFTNLRDEKTPDEFWFTQHKAVFTLGTSRSKQHILNHENVNKISLVQSDRGGEVTFHSPGQLIMYPLVNIKRLELNLKNWLGLLEQSVINLLAAYGFSGQRLKGAPGVYVSGKKIASLGLRIKKGCSYHGIALNVDMDLTPFSYINPCGLANISVTQLKNSPRFTLDISNSKFLKEFINEWFALLKIELAKYIK